MNKVQFIKTANGDELAVLPKQEYERLAVLAAGEDAGTARIVRKARADIAAGREEILPKTIVDRLMNGENPVRTLREWRQKTQAELAVQVGIKQGYLSGIETGTRKGPVALHQKLARALGVPIGFLLSIAVSEQEADPERGARRGRIVKEMQNKTRRNRGER